MVLIIYLIGMVFTAVLAALLTPPDEPAWLNCLTVLLWFIALPVSMGLVLYLCLLDRAAS